MIRKTVILLCLTLKLTLLSAQNSFHGNFLMSFRSAAGSDQDAALLWNIQSALDGGKMAMEILDDMKIKGVTKRVLFNPADSTWTMTMEYVNSKVGTRIHAAAMFRATMKVQKIKMKTSGGRRIIDGYRCKKIILESDDYLSEVWLTDQFTFDLCYISKLVTHCGLMSDYVRHGDWFNWKNTKGMILEVTSTKKKTGESYTMNISEVKAVEVSQAFFNTSGFKISEIPEGQNCGAGLEGK